MKLRKPPATAAEVSEHYRIPLKTLYQWRYLGIGPRAAKIGKHLRYDWDDCDAWFEQRKSGGAA